MTHKASILPLLWILWILDNESFWMSLKSTFLAFKKSCWPNWGEGRKGGNLDKIQKNSNIFLWYRPLMWLSMMIMLIMIKCWSSQPRKQEQRYKGYNVYKHEREGDHLYGRCQKKPFLGTLSQTMGRWGSKVPNFLVKITIQLFLLIFRTLS